MSCERFAGAIADHALGAEIAPNALDHLNACERCRARYASQRSTIGALDADLQRAIGIAPSSGFDRAVRERIARRSDAAPRAVWWVPLAAAAAVAIAVGLNALRTSERRIETTSSPIATQSAPVTSGSAEKVGPAVVSPPQTQRGPLANRTTRRASSSLPRVEVIVEPEQREALTRYLVLVRSGILDTSNLAKEPQAVGEPPELVVPPLGVEPLTVTDVEIRNSPSGDRRGPQEFPADAGTTNK
jgi:hypothetical protein